jgi:P27 family predicted phage terminase small subunit
MPKGGDAIRTGRPPRPIEDRRADGTPSARDAKVPLLVAGRPTGKPTAPTWLSAEGKKAFKLIVTTLWEAGYLDQADALLVVVAADALGDAIAAARDLNERGLTIEGTRVTRTGDRYTVPAKNPSYQVKADAMRRFRQTCPELGIGPAARTHLANVGVRGKSPTELPGIGCKPTPLSQLREANGSHLPPTCANHLAVE